MPLDDELAAARGEIARLQAIVSVLETGFLRPQGAARGPYRDPAGAALERARAQELELARTQGEIAWLERRAWSLRADWARQSACRPRPDRAPALVAWALACAAALLATLPSIRRPEPDGRIFWHCSAGDSVPGPGLRVRYVPEGDAAWFFNHEPGRIHGTSL